MQANIERIYNAIRLTVLIVAVLLIALVSITETHYRVIYTINPGETTASKIDTVVYLKFNTDFNYANH